jgi:glycosyltransferase involved in cell wall biosynthesis
MVKTANKKILLVIPNLGRGGAQQVFRDQLKFFSNSHDTVGCVFNWEGAFEDDRLIKIISLDIPAGRNWLSKIYYFWKRVYALRKIKKEKKISFSISHLEGADYVNLFSKRSEKVICWIHGTKSFDENIEGTLGSIRKKFLIPLTYQRSDLIVTVSEGIRQELIRDFAVSHTQVKTIYNGFDLPEISSKSLQNLDSKFESLFATETVLITHCRLSRQKNLIALIDIFALSAKYRPGIKLLILGDGELKSELLEHCKTLNLAVYSVWNTNLAFNTAYDIYFLGYERNPYPFLRRASLYLMTSSWEGFPLSLCEAMACEVAVVSSDCYTGPREIIGPDVTEKQPVAKPIISSYGVLMPLADGQNNQMWVNTIVEMLDSPDVRNQLRIKGRQRVAVFEKKEISLKWLSLIQ